MGDGNQHAPPLRVLSLFSGIGGLDLGLERAGMHIVAHSENDEYASQVLAKHWPDVPNLGDITQIEWDTRLADTGRIIGWTTPTTPVYLDRPNVICGGFPCQDISLAGKGAGIDEGTRSGLWLEYARCVRDIRPRYVVIENVAALTSRGIDRVLRDLAALGYGAWWDCIPAASVGAPHLRERIFIVATRADVAPFYPDATPIQWASQFGSEPHGDTAGAATDGDGDGGGREERAEPHGESQRPGQQAPLGHDPDGLRGAATDPDDAGRIKQRRPEPTPPQQPATQRRDPLPHSGRPIDDAQRRRHGHQDEALRAGGEADEPASWWAAEPGVGRVAAGIPRRVDRLRCLGNAVVPQVAQYIGEQIVRHHQETTCQTDCHNGE